jgi:hypothetical protein
MTFTGRRIVRKHDVEEFTEIVGRWGAWQSDLEQFLATPSDGAPCLKRPAAFFSFGMSGRSQSRPPSATGTSLRS